MPLLTRNGEPHWTPSTPQQRIVRGLTLVGILLLTAFAWQVLTANTHWEFVADAFQQGNRLLARMFPPDFAYFPTIVRPLIDTINIATLGTLGATLLAVPVALGAARNTTPHSLVRALCLLIIVTSRSVHSLVWALLLVFVFGPGSFAGVLAITLRAIGFIAKLLYESIEEVSRSSVEAIEATGASPAQRILYGITPQVLPNFAGIVLFRWDINIRESTFLGLVGAGGVGMLLDANVNALNFPRAAIILLAILAMVIAAEWLSAQIRSRIR